MANSRYAQFRKADLQMQTPSDRHHWVGRSLVDGGAGMSVDADEDEVRESARRYARRCVEVGLEIIGLTDHNLGREGTERYYAVLQDELGRRGITVFPGFEVSLDQVGTGAHFLCLFEPGTEFGHLSDVLSEMRLATSGRWGQGRPLPASISFDDLMTTVSKHEGLVIAAHADSNKGITDERTTAATLTQQIIGDERLLAIELRRPRHRYETGDSLAALTVQNRPGWGRPQPIAVVNSSDCKRLGPDDGGGTECFIGKRWTWIKTGHKPSIRSLRQAFLDHASRIRFPGDPLDTAEPAPDRQPRRVVSSLSISGASFLEDQTIEFSPELNCLIGGGGTGKSTIIEYLRHALRAPPMMAGGAGNGSSSPVSTLGPASEVTVVGGSSGEVEVTLSHGDIVRARDDAGEVADVATRLPVRVIGQREVFEIASDSDALRQLVDDLDRDELSELDSRARELGRRLAALDGEQERLTERNERREAVRAEVERKQHDLAGASRLAEPFRAVDGLRAEHRVLGRINERLVQMRSEIDDFADSLTLGVSTSELEGRHAPHRSAIEAHRAAAVARVEAAAEQVKGAAGHLALHESVALGAAILDESTAAEAQYRQVAADTPGITDVADLGRDIDARMAELEELDEEIEALKLSLPARMQLMAQLRTVWEDQTEVRVRLAARINEGAPKNRNGEPYVRLDVERFGDVRAALQEVLQLIDDRRRFSSADLDELVAVIEADRGSGQNPIDLLCEWVKDDPVKSPLASFSETRRSVLQQACSGALGRRLDRFRPPDKVVVHLFRHSGEEVGTLDQGMSVGQKCIAVLSVLLASGDTPIVIDQPEDEIDNEFIYRELVPLLRKAKQGRQIILATHNANIPVNGDAELIYALETRKDGEDVRGGPKQVRDGGSSLGGTTAVGSLDLVAVLLAVEEIMEGSKEAFERRRLKYGF